jgi:hypothetical protein
MDPQESKNLKALNNISNYKTNENPFITLNDNDPGNLNDFIEACSKNNCNNNIENNVIIKNPNGQTLGQVNFNAKS